MDVTVLVSAVRRYQLPHPHILSHCTGIGSCALQEADSLVVPSCGYTPRDMA